MSEALSRCAKRGSRHPLSIIESIARDEARWFRLSIGRRTVSA